MPKPNKQDKQETPSGLRSLINFFRTAFVTTFALDWFIRALNEIGALVDSNRAYTPTGTRDRFTKSTVGQDLFIFTFIFALFEPLINRIIWLGTHRRLFKPELDQLIDRFHEAFNVGKIAEKVAKTHGVTVGSLRPQNLTHLFELSLKKGQYAETVKQSYFGSATKTSEQLAIEQANLIRAYFSDAMGCDLIRSTQLEKQNLTASSRPAYILTDDKLYYISKKQKNDQIIFEQTELDVATKHLDELREIYKNNQSQTLTDQQLGQIAAITGHEHKGKLPAALRDELIKYDWSQAEISSADRAALRTTLLSYLPFFTADMAEQKPNRPTLMFGMTWDTHFFMGSFAFSTLLSTILPALGISSVMLPLLGAVPVLTFGLVTGVVLGLLVAAAMATYYNHVTVRWGLSRIEEETAKNYNLAVDAKTQKLNFTLNRDKKQTFFEKWFGFERFDATGAQKEAFRRRKHLLFPSQIDLGWMMRCFFLMYTAIAIGAMIGGAWPIAIAAMIGFTLATLQVPLRERVIWLIDNKLSDRFKRFLNLPSNSEDDRVKPLQSRSSLAMVRYDIPTLGLLFFATNISLLPIGGLSQGFAFGQSLASLLGHFIAPTVTAVPPVLIGFLVVAGILWVTPLLVQLAQVAIARWRPPVAPESKPGFVDELRVGKKKVHAVDIGYEAMPWFMRAFLGALVAMNIVPVFTLTLPATQVLFMLGSFAVTAANFFPLLMIVVPTLAIISPLVYDILKYRASTPEERKHFAWSFKKPLFEMPLYYRLSVGAFLGIFVGVGAVLFFAPVSAALIAPVSIGVVATTLLLTVASPFIQEKLGWWYSTAKVAAPVEIAKIDPAADKSKAPDAAATTTHAVVTEKLPPVNDNGAGSTPPISPKAPAERPLTADALRSPETPPLPALYVQPHQAATAAAPDPTLSADKQAVLSA